MTTIFSSESCITLLSSPAYVTPPATTNVNINININVKDNDNDKFCTASDETRLFSASSTSPIKMAKIHTPIPALKLSDSTSMPMLAYGTGTAWYKSAPDGESRIDEALVSSINLAIDLDYTHLDGAEVYKTETELGNAITKSGKKRDELYVVTKVIHNLKDIEGSLKTSLKKLQVDYVDLYLIHAPFSILGEGELEKAWKDMEAVKEKGLTKSIGVSNYRIEDLTRTLKIATHPPVCNQIEAHPYCVQPELLAFHKQHNIATTAYSPLTPITKASGGPLDSYLAALSKKYAVNPSEILLRWCIDQDIVPVTTSGKEQRLSDYLRCATFKLTPKEIEEITFTGKGLRKRIYWEEQLGK